MNSSRIILEKTQGKGKNTARKVSKSDPHFPVFACSSTATYGPGEIPF